MSDAIGANLDIKSLNILLVGVGGQGTILASNILAELGLDLGYDVKKAEVHGMAQRGGSVISHVRWGEQVFSPLIARGECDVLVAFEKMEVLRYLYFLRSGGVALINDHSIIPITITAGGGNYPQDEHIHASLADVTDQIYWVDGVNVAETLGNARVSNVVILGALSTLLKMETQPWFRAIETCLPPQYLEINKQAFLAGRELVANGS